MGQAYTHQAFISEVAAELRRFCRRDGTRTSISLLVRLAASIARQRLWGRLLAASRANGTTIEQEALSVVAGLFGTDSPAMFSELLQIDNQESDDISIFLRFQAIVTRAASQELFHRWPETDPLSARLWRTVHRVLRHDDHFVLFPSDRPVWTALSEVKDLRPEKPPIDFDALAGTVSGAYSPGKSITALIADILMALADSDKYQLCISVDMLFAVLRQTIIAASQTEEVADISQAAPNPLLAIAIKRSSEKTSEEVHKILTRYHLTAKLPADYIEPFQKALVDIIADRADGFEALGYFHYLHQYIPDLTPEEYRGKYRTRFEYLADIAQTCFFDLMRQEMTEKSRQPKAIAPISDSGTKKGDR